MNESATTVSYVGAGLPDGWRWNTIGEICNTTSGGTPSRAIKEYFKGNIPWVKSGELPDGLVIKTGEYITEEAVKHSSAKIFPSGTLLIAMYGATVGKLGIINREAATNQAVCAVFPHKELFTKYLFWYLKSLRADLISKSLGGAQPNISQGILRNIPIPLAPLPQQLLIVAEIEKQFSRLDEAVAALKRIQANLKRYKASVLKAAVEGKLTEEWRKNNLCRGGVSPPCICLPKTGRGDLAPTEYETCADLLKRILVERRNKWEEDYIKKYVATHGHAPKDDSWKKKYKEPASPDTSNLLELPKGWVWATIEQLANKVQYGSSAKTNENSFGVPVLRMGNIFEGRLRLDDLKYLPQKYSEFPELLLKEGDLLFNRTNSPELVGKSAVYLGSPNPCSFASYLIRVQFNNRVNSNLVSFYVNSTYGRSWIKSVVSQQVGQANVNGTKLQALSVPLPPYAKQQIIIEEVERCLSVTEEMEAAIEANLKRADRLRHSILKKAFSGRLIPHSQLRERASA